MSEKNVKVLAAIYDALSKCQIHPDVCLDVERAAETTIGSLALDSLDLLQFAMDVEDELNIDIDIVEFPAQATIQDIADHVAVLMQSKDDELEA